MIYLMMTMRRRLIFPALVLTVLLCGSLTGYDYYRAFAWPQESATVVSIRQICRYVQKSEGRHERRQDSFCDDGPEAARLSANGYRMQDQRWLRIEAVYDSGPGKEILVTLAPPLEEAGAITPGSVINIRVSSGRAELAVMPNPALAVLIGIMAASTGLYAYLSRSWAFPLW